MPLYKFCFGSVAAFGDGMPKSTSPLILGEYWLDKRRDGKSPHRWQIAWVDRSSNSITYRSTRETDEERAKKVLRTYVRNKDAGRISTQPIIKPNPMALPVIPQLYRYMEEQGSYAVSAITIEAHLRGFVAFLQQDEVGLACTFDDVGKHLIERYRRWAMAPNSWSIEWKGKVVRSRSRGVCGATVRRSLASVKAALNLAKEDKIVPYVWHIPPLGPEYKSPVRDRTLTPKELGSMFAYASEDKALLNWLKIMLACAVRPTAATLLIPRSQWRPEVLRLNLQPVGARRTNKRNPLVPIIPQLLPELLSHEGHWIPQSLSRATLGYRWRQMRESLGLSNEVVPKTLRHTIATHLANRRVSQFYISLLLGHVTIVRWRDFDDISPDFYDAIVPAISDLWDEVHDEARAWLARFAVVTTYRGSRAVVSREKADFYGASPLKVSPFDVVSPTALKRVMIGGV